MEENWIVDKSDLVLVTGASGFVGIKVVESLLESGFTKIRCLLRSSRQQEKLRRMAAATKAEIECVQGTLMSAEDCVKAVKDVAVVYHLAVGSCGKSFPGAVMNVVLPTRNLLDACVRDKSLKRFVNISSFAVYSNCGKPRRNLLDELSPVEEHPENRGDAYAYAKLKQDKLVIEYGGKYGMPYVILRPGTVYGPGKDAIPGRVGIDTFGVFLHLGGSNRIPFSYVENCADAIVLAGVVKSIDGEVFNIVDDDLPTSRKFLRLYKKNVRHFRSIYVPHTLSYLLCLLWEKYSAKSEGQLPPVFSRSEWHAYWKKTRYSNEKLKNRLGWKMQVPTGEGLVRYFEGCRKGSDHA